jgi:phage/plasmid primase-like uncharacterized protein
MDMRRHARIDIEALRAALIDRAECLYPQVFGEPNPRLSNGRELRWGNHGSLCVAIAGAKAGLWCDHESGQGGDFLALLMIEAKCGFPEACRRAADMVGGSAATITAARRPAPPDNKTTPADAAKLWRAAESPIGSCAERYLNRRRLKVTDDLADAVIRYDYRTKEMIAPFRDIRTGEGRAVQRTKLDGFDGKVWRKFCGPTKDAAVMLDPFAEVGTRLHIGEGLETCLAARQIGYRPVWALGSAGAIATFPVLPAIESLTILAEKDDDGANARALQACADRWIEAGREVYQLEPLVGDDINSALIEGRK